MQRVKNCDPSVLWIDQSRVAGPSQKDVEQSLLTSQSSSMNFVESRSLASSPLVSYALKGLQRCWLPEHGRWSHIYHLDGRDRPNQSLPPSDVFYTLNVLLGLSRLGCVPNGIDVSATFERNVLQLPILPIKKYAYGMALWAAAELRLDIPVGVMQDIKTLLSEERNWRHFRAQDLGMILSGIVAQARAGRKELYRFAEPLFVFLVDRYHSASGLFFNEPFGLRRRFASFASQTYSTLACYAYGELVGNERAISIANACTRKLISLQGPHGEWPWFFDAQKGLVLDFYEVYSVHQYGMAPAFLECAERHDVPGVRQALIKGFEWVLGNNQLAKPMLVPELHLSIRSQLRKHELHTTRARMVRAAYNAFSGCSAGLTEPVNLQTRLECRSYELGWILWSFGKRADLCQLTHNQIFIDAVAGR
jgi:hypothetical protein